MKKIIVIMLTLALALPLQQADAGILFGEGGLFQQIRANRVARVNARVSARQAASARYNSYGSSGSSGYSYGSNGGAGRYEVVTEVIESEGSDGGTGATGALPATNVRYRSFTPLRSGCIRDAAGRLFCPTSANTEANCPCGENCNCVDCDCNTSLAGKSAPILDQETSLVGVQAPDASEQGELYVGL